MQFIYPFAHLPKDDQLLININAAATRLHQKLRRLNVDSLNISEYNKRYLGGYLKNIHKTLQRHSYILSWAVATVNIPLNKFVFLDHGGGAGILSLLAKQLNIGTVIYNDIYELSCKDANIIGKTLEIQADYYIPGDIEDVIKVLKKKSISCNAIASNDVIEHIYDIDRFLNNLHLFSDTTMNVALSSNANIYNPLMRRILMKNQRDMEYKDRVKKWGDKQRDTLKAYQKIRKEIIQSYAADLNNEEVQRLVDTTRGMIVQDIKSCVDNYLKTKQFPPQPKHPTNTCDPYTGNWAEHLMDLDHVVKILVKTGFKVKILPGFYGQYKNFVLRVIGRFLNLIICNSDRFGIKLAPFYTIYGTKHT
ncbi:MAG: hypothetical protein FVQ77_03475 [Cytophagales bacterium]|nr:hypothetical protein [Cytophagales bacterium]